VVFLIDSFPISPRICRAALFGWPTRSPNYFQGFEERVSSCVVLFRPVTFEFFSEIPILVFPWVQGSSPLFWDWFEHPAVGCLPAPERKSPLFSPQSQTSFFLVTQASYCVGPQFFSPHFYNLLSFKKLSSFCTLSPSYWASGQKELPVPPLFF